MALAEPTGTKGAPPVRAAAGVANAIVKLNTDTKKRATTDPVQMVAGLCSRSRYGSVTGADKLIVNKDLMSINETMHAMRGARWRPMPGHRSQSSRQSGQGEASGLSERNEMVATRLFFAGTNATGARKVAVPVPGINGLWAGTWQAFLYNGCPLYPHSSRRDSVRVSIFRRMILFRGDYRCSLVLAHVAVKKTSAGLEQLQILQVRYGPSFAKSGKWRRLAGKSVGI